MVLIPFIYFTALTVYWWIKHQGFDVCVYISSLYAFTSFCSVVVVFGGLVEGENGVLFDQYDLELGLIPTLLYCVLLTAGLYPFSLIYNNDIKKGKEISSFIMDSFCWILFFIFLITFYLIADSTVEILSGDLSTVRSDHYEGIESPAEVKAQSLHPIFGYILYLRHASILALPLFFYYNCFTEKSWWFKGMLILSSLSFPLYGMQMADRTEFTFYGMMFIFCLILFKKFLTRRFKIRLAAIGTPLILAVLIYLVAVSQARFSEDDDNDKAYISALHYAGQSYLNFCYFWEHGKFQYIAPEREFPLTSHVVAHIDSNPERRGERSGQQGFYISVFATYIGDIMLDLSPIGVVTWSLFFFFLSLCTIRYAHKEEYDVGDVLAYFTLAAIPIFGIFYYRYYSVAHIYMCIMVVVLYFFSKKQFVYQ